MNYDFCRMDVWEILYKTRSYNELLLCRMDVLEILYKIAIFCGDRTTNMTPLSIVRVCDCQLNKKCSLKSFG